jgi:hypothetical protein
MRDASTLAAAAMQLGAGLAIAGATMALRAGDAVAGGGQSAVTVALCVLVLIAAACAAGALRLDQAAAREVPAERGAHGVVTKHDAASCDSPDLSFSARPQCVSVRLRRGVARCTQRDNPRRKETMRFPRKLAGLLMAAGLHRRGAPGPEIPVVQMRAIDCVFGYQVNPQGLLQSVRGYWVAPLSASLPQSPALSPTAHPGLRRRTNERQPRAGTTTHRELNRRT